MVSAVLEKALEELDPDDRYLDPDLKLAEDSGRVGPEIVEWVRTRISDLVSDEEALTDLVGSILSEPRRYVEGAQIEDSLASALQHGALRPATSSQVLYEIDSMENVKLFVAGEPVLLGSEALPLVKKLIEGTGLTSNDISGEPEFAELLEDLYFEGVLVTG